MRIVCFVLLVLMGAPFVQSAVAQEDEVKIVKDGPMESFANPHLPKVKAKAKELEGLLSEDEAAALLVVRNSYGMVRSLKMVQRDIQNTVTACSEKNPDMKAEMDAAYDDWMGKIKPAIKSNDDRYEEALTYFSNGNVVREYMGLIDQAAQFADDLIHKDYLSEKEECETLRDSMGQSGDQIAQLLAEIEWPDLQGLSKEE